MAYSVGNLEVANYANTSSGKVTSGVSSGNNGSVVVVGPVTYASGGSAGTILPGDYTYNTGTFTTGTYAGNGGTAGGAGAFNVVSGSVTIDSFSFHVNKGEGLPKHSHIYAHASFCTAGSCIIRKENKELVMDKTTQPVNLLQDSWHEIEALEDNTVFINVFADKHNG